MGSKKYILLFGSVCGVFLFIYFLDPGSIQITWLGIEIRLSLALAFVGVLGVFCLYKLLVYFLSWLFKIPQEWLFSFQSLWKKDPPEAELIRLTQLSLDAHLWKDARSYLTLLLKRAPNSEVYRLLAILELQENKNTKAAIGWLEKSLMTQTLSSEMAN